MTSVRQRYVERLARYEDEELTFAPRADQLNNPATPAFAAYATLRFGLSVRHTIDWCDWLLDQLASPRLSWTLTADTAGTGTSGTNLSLSARQISSLRRRTEPGSSSRCAESWAKPAI